MSWRYAGYTTQKHTTPALGFFQMMGTDLHAHAARDFTHRNEKGQGAILFYQSFVGESRCARREHRIAETAAGCKMKIGEDELAGPEEGVLVRKGLFDFHYELGLFVTLGNFIHQAGARHHVVLVAEAGARARTLFHPNPVAIRDEGACSERGETDTVLV